MNPKSRIGIVLAASAPLFMAGCGDAAGGAGAWEGEVRDSAGIEVVSNTGSGAWSAEQAWTVEPDLMIGAESGETYLQFGLIAGIDVGDDGRIYVMDQQATEVRVFDAEGGFVARMGRAGGGPGELGQQAGPVFVDTDGTVTVPDMMNQRITRYTATGESAGEFPLPMTDGISARWMKTTDGQLVQQAMIMAMPGMENVEPKTLLIRRRVSGEVVDTLLTLPIGQTLEFGSGGAPTITLFEAEPMWTTDPLGRIVSGNNSEYRVEVRDGSGGLERIITMAGSRQAISEGDQEDFRQILAEAWEDAGMAPQVIEMMAGSVQFAETYPAYANLLGGPDGTLWVQSVQTPETVKEQGGEFDIQDFGGADWHVFGADGRLLGTVGMPPSFTPMLFRGDDVYGVQRDEFDVQHVARMRIVRGGAER